MNSAHASDNSPSGTALASWYTPGRSDGFGDRLLMFDNTDAISLELLRFRPEIVTTGFENALRDRVEHLARFRHPAFPALRATVHLDNQALTMVSANTAGQRLSELSAWKARKGLHPAVVTWMVREVTPAVAALQESGPLVAHGALNADRIVITGDGGLRIVEHALGAALRRLRLTPAVLWRQFGLLAPVDDKGFARIDARTDVVQLGTIALSLLIARPVTLRDFQRGLPVLLDEFASRAAVSPSAFTAPLRVWLERALQLSPRAYRSAKEAQEGLQELPVPVRPAAPVGSAAAAADAVYAPISAPEAADRRRVTPLAALEEHRPPRPAPVRDPPIEALSTASPEAMVTEPQTRAPGISRGWQRTVIIALSMTLAAIALGEGLIIARIGSQPAIVSVTAPAAAAPARHPADAIPAGSIPPAPEGPAAVTNGTGTADVMTLAGARQRSGGVRLSSPIVLTVFEGDRVLGSTADGPIVTTAGIHDLDLVNTTLGYRSRRTVTIQTGVITPMTIPVPAGRININAQPWAQVLIDDTAIGDTPLANVSVPLGQHEVTFRHPQLGERRETVLVRADTVARVSTTFVR